MTIANIVKVRPDITRKQLEWTAWPKCTREHSSFVVRFHEDFAKALLGRFLSLAAMRQRFNGPRHERL